MTRTVAKCICGEDRIGRHVLGCPLAKKVKRRAGPARKRARSLIAKLEKLEKDIRKLRSEAAKLLRSIKRI